MNFEENLSEGLTCLQKNVTRILVVFQTWGEAFLCEKQNKISLQNGENKNLAEGVSERLAAS